MIKNVIIIITVYLRTWKEILPLHTHQMFSLNLTKVMVYKSAISFVLGNCEHITRLYISEEKSHSFNFSE